LQYLGDFDKLPQNNKGDLKNSPGGVEIVDEPLQKPMKQSDTRFLERQALVEPLRGCGKCDSGGVLMVEVQTHCIGSWEPEAFRI